MGSLGERARRAWPKEYLGISRPGPSPAAQRAYQDPHAFGALDALDLAFFNRARRCGSHRQGRDYTESLHIHIGAMAHRARRGALRPRDRLPGLRRA